MESIHQLFGFFMNSSSVLSLIVKGCLMTSSAGSADPQEDGGWRGQTHTDWLTLNVGGRCFTTTRYVAPPTLPLFFGGCPPSFRCSPPSPFRLLRSTLVSKEPESMLAHMFRGKGDARLRGGGRRAAEGDGSGLCCRCLGQQAGRCGGVPDRPQPRVL